MSLQRVFISLEFTAPIADVFDWFSEHENLDLLFPGNRHKRIHDASASNPNGVGSIRHIALAGPVPGFEETIVVANKPNRIEYKITKGSPLKNHHGVMEFSEANGRTLLEYTIHFEGRIPGTGGLIARSVRKQLAKGMPAVVKALSKR